MIQRYMLHRYWKRRRNRKYRRHLENSFFKKMGYIALVLVSILIIHSLAMVYLEKMSFADALWLSITTTTTVGYGDFSASSWQGRLMTTICIYIFGIALLAQMAAEFFDYRVLIRERKIKGLWRWKDMKQHLLIVNTPKEDTERYLVKLIEQIRVTPDLEDLPIQILTRKYNQGLPTSLSNMGVVHYSGVAENSDNLEAVNVNVAKYIILITRDPADPISDSLTFDVLNRIKDIGTNATLIVEVAQDENRQRMRSAGANVIIRPIRAYPELLVRSIVAPGTEEVLENLFTHDDDHMVRFDFPFENMSWSDIVCRFVTGGAGVPLAYVNDSGVHCNPLPDELCTGAGIISLINDSQQVTSAQAQQCLA